MVNKRVCDNNEGREKKKRQMKRRVTKEVMEGEEGDGLKANH